MKTLITLLTAIGLFICGFANANETSANQERGFITEKGVENWFFSFGAGGNLYLGQNDSEVTFTNRIGYGGSIHFGKWFTPCVGFRVGVDGGKYKGGVFATESGSFITPNAYWEGEETRNNSTNLAKQEFVAFNPKIDILFSLFNSIGKINNNRVYDMILNIGGGIFVNSRYNVDKSTTLNGCYNTLSPTLNFGLINRFKVSDSWDINIELNGGWVMNSFDGEVISQGVYSKGDIITSARVSATYKFKPRGTKLYRDIATKNQQKIDSLNAKCNMLRGEIIKGAADNEAAAIAIKELEGINNMLCDSINKLNNNQIVDIIGRTTVATIEFKIGSSEITNAALKRLKSAAKVMEANQNTKYEVCGYADNATGSKERNIRLRNARANRAINILLAYGASRNQILKGTDDSDSNSGAKRAVIISELDCD